MNKGIKSTLMSVRLGLELATQKQDTITQTTVPPRRFYIVNTSIYIIFRRICYLLFWGIIFVVCVSHTQNRCVANVIIVITSYSYIACQIDTIRSHQ